MRSSVCLSCSKVIATSAGSNDIDSREDALVGQVAVELQFHITSTFELFKDHFVHLEPVSISAVARMVSEPPPSMLQQHQKEAFRLVQCVGVHTSGQYFYPKPGKQYCRHVPNVLWSQGR